MNRVSMIHDMRLMLDSMNNMLVRARVQGILCVPIGSEKLTTKFIKEGHDWLKEVYGNQYKDVDKVWKLLPEALWKRYEVWGDFEEHREAKMLTAALCELRKAIICIGRPAFFKKSIINKRLDKKVKNENKEGT